VLLELEKRGQRVNVWLDPDAAGQRGATKIIKQLRLFGIEYRNIISTRDPKLHTREEIRSYLS
jgi:5S rRNA maturation endonuclease (ribonuclease M5)